ncbi:hypothetical protein D3C76_1032310 [compost metagenome]
MHRQLASLGPPFGAQAHLELAGAHLLQRPQQLIEQAHAAAHGPADGQQTDQQGHRAQAEQLLQGIPDFVDFIPRVDCDLHPSAIGQIENACAVSALSEQQACEPGIESVLHGWPGLFIRHQPVHTHMAQALGQPWLQADRVTGGGFAQVLDHRFGRLQFTLHIRQRLMHQQRRARQGDQREKAADPQVDPPQGRHA